MLKKSLSIAGVVLAAALMLACVGVFWYGARVLLEPGKAEVVAMTALSESEHGEMRVVESDSDSFRGKHRFVLRSFDGKRTYEVAVERRKGRLEIIRAVPLRSMSELFSAKGSVQ